VFRQDLKLRSALTCQSSGQPKACFAVSSPPLTSTLDPMNKLLLLAASFCLVAGCATNEPQYQVGGQASRQTRADAERIYAKQAGLVTPTGSFDTPPRVLSSQFPDYPPSWRNAGIVGAVIVSFSVEPDGSVSNPEIEGSPPAELAAITLNAILRWRFAPATKGGIPVRVRAHQQFVFKTE
jgi:TonB family protein